MSHLVSMSATIINCYAVHLSSIGRRYVGSSHHLPSSITHHAFIIYYCLVHWLTGTFQQTPSNLSSCKYWLFFPLPSNLTSSPQPSVGWLCSFILQPSFFTSSHISIFSSARLHVCTPTTPQNHHRILPSHGRAPNPFAPLFILVATLV